MRNFCKNICVCQKKAVPLSSLLKKGVESVAQQVEHIPFKDGVLGSSPSWFTEREQALSFLLYFHGKRIDILYNPILAKNKRLVISPVLLHKFAIRLFQADI